MERTRTRSHLDPKIPMNERICVCFDYRCKKTLTVDVFFVYLISLCVRSNFLTMNYYYYLFTLLIYFLVLQVLLLTYSHRKNVLRGQEKSFWSSKVFFSSSFLFFCLSFNFFFFEWKNICVGRDYCSKKRLTFDLFGWLGFTVKRVNWKKSFLYNKNAGW